MRFFVGLLLLAACGSPRASSQELPAVPGPIDNGPPIIVELFTSQGCSSCPAADQVVAELAANDLRVLPLSFHVDYWDRLGFRDPYSQPEWTARQEAYARVLNDRGLYTPQLIVGGRQAMVGSHRAAIRDAIAVAPRPARLAIRGDWSEDALKVVLDASAAEPVWVALFLPGEITAVPTGENAGQQLATTHPVRQLVQITVGAGDGPQSIALGDHATELRAVAFTQAIATGVISQVALLPR